MPLTELMALVPLLSIVVSPFSSLSEITRGKRHGEFNIRKELDKRGMYIYIKHLRINF